MTRTVPETPAKPRKSTGGRRIWPEDVTIGANIRAMRLRRSMSQDALAEVLGVAFQQVQKYEKGNNRVSASRLVRIAAALQVPVAALLSGVDGGKLLPPITDAYALRAADALIAIKDPQLRGMLVRLVERLAAVTRSK